MDNMDSIEFFVHGIPAPGGSKTAFRHAKTGRIIVMDACKRNKPWRDTVASFAIEHAPDELLSCPLSLDVTFIMPRPKYHYRTGKYSGMLKDSAPHWHTVKPDATKLLRALEDALTGIMWTDDSIIVKQYVNKTYAYPHDTTKDAWTKPGAYVKIGVVS